MALKRVGKGSLKRDSILFFMGEPREFVLMDMSGWKYRNILRPKASVISA